MGRIISTTLLTRMIFVLLVYFLVVGLYEEAYAGKEFNLDPFADVVITAPESEEETVVVNYSDLREDEIWLIIAQVADEFDTRISHTYSSGGWGIEGYANWLREGFESGNFSDWFMSGIQNILDEVERMNRQNDVPYDQKVAFVQNEARKLYARGYAADTGEVNIIEGTGRIIAGTEEIIEETSVSWLTRLWNAITEILKFIGKALTFDITVPPEYEPFMIYVRFAVTPAVTIPFSLIIIELVLYLIEVLGGLIPFT